jgi:hypothetical protein
MRDSLRYTFAARIGRGYQTLVPRRTWLTGQHAMDCGTLQPGFAAQFLDQRWTHFIYGFTTDTFPDLPALLELLGQRQDDARRRRYAFGHVPWTP